MYSKDNPSERFIKLTKDYQEIHRDGTAGRKPKDTYNGLSTIVFADILKEIIKDNACKTLLDYGSGKGERYYKESSTDNKNFPPLKEYWGIEPTLYDPGIPYLKKPENNNFDIVISIDVLEHIPIEDMVWVMDEMFQYAKKAIFINVACYPAKATLKNGENAHVSLYSPHWWSGFFTAIANKYNIKSYLICTYIENNKKKYFSFALNDNFEKYK